MILLRKEINRLRKQVFPTLTEQKMPQIGLALLIDPVEELFTRPGTTEEQIEGFLNTLHTLTGSKLIFVLGSLRSDFYERCAKYPRLMEMLSDTGEYRLAPPKRSEIQQMIEEPAQRAGLTFEQSKDRPKLSELILEEALPNPEALPFAGIRAGRNLPAQPAPGSEDPELSKLRRTRRHFAVPSPSGPMTLMPLSKRRLGVNGRRPPSTRFSWAGRPA